jgi:hypothetical protein
MTKTATRIEIEKLFRTRSSAVVRGRHSRKEKNAEFAEDVQRKEEVSQSSAAFSSVVSAFKTSAGRRIVKAL